MWLLPALAVAVAVIIAGAVVHQQQRGSQSGPGSSQEGAPLPADVAHDLAGVPPGTWNRAPAAGVTRPALVGTPAPGTRPLVLYVGAEYCPYCAVMRWPLVAALDRFGTFTGLALSTSSATDVFPRTPTLTFLHQQYTSRYLLLQTVELQGNVQDAQGRYPPLESPTAAQVSLLNRFDPRGDIPFLLIGGRYLLAGSPFSPALLQGMDWHAIAASLPSGNTAAARAILATGNEIAAAICAVDGGQPAAVCQTRGVRTAAQALPRGAP